MSTATVGRRKKLTPEEKKANDQQFVLPSPTIFYKHIGYLIQVYKSLMKLSNKLATYGKGNSIAISVSGGMAILTKADLRASSALFVEELKKIKSYYRMARRKKTGGAAPKSFKSVFTPVLMGNAMRKYVNDANFGPLYPASGGPTRSDNSRLIDYLPLVKSGICLRTTLQLLFYANIYTEQMQKGTNRQDVTPSGALLSVFSTQPALYSFKPGVEGGKVDKHGQLKSVKQGNPNDRTTFQILSAENPKIVKGQLVPFTDKSFRLFFIQSIIALNVYSKGDPAIGEENLRILNDKEQRDRMLAEYDIISKINKPEWAALLEPGRKLKRKTEKKTTKVKPVYQSVEQSLQALRK
jgi:hypothetical protein